MENVKCVLCPANPKHQNLNYFRATTQRAQPFVICENCIKLLAQALGDVQEKVPKKADLIEFDPKDVFAHLSRFVVGQDEAKEVLSVAVYQHYQRIKTPGLSHKANILLCGPTGSGKTFLVQKIAEFLNVPFAQVDLTSITPRGYVGESPELMVEKLLAAAGGNVEQAERGIIFLDEFDKVPAGHEFGSFKSKLLQGELLKIVEADTVEVKLNEQGQRASVNTKNILFIAAGAFSSLFETNEERAMGFAPSTPTMKGRELGVDDFVAFGLIPELLGRFPVVCATQDLGVDQLVTILRDSEESVLKYYQTLFAQRQVELRVLPETLLHIATDAIKGNLGARGLKRMLETRLRPLLFRIDEFQGKTLILKPLDHELI